MVAPGRLAALACRTPSRHLPCESLLSTINLSTVNLPLEVRVAIPSELYPFVFFHLQNLSNKTVQLAKY
jgi:hypothetical protein